MPDISPNVDTCTIKDEIDNQSNIKPILCVGLVCLDVISVCKDYPREDTDQRAVSQRWQRGGSASNNCSVLKKLGADVDFAGTVAEGTIETCFMMKGFLEYTINTHHVVSRKQCSSPLTVAIVNESNGSRTILHFNKDKLEYTIEDFLKIDLTRYSWIHFETRYDVATIVNMIKAVTRFNESNPSNKITISVEIEKPRLDYEDLLGLTDFTFISKDLAKHRGLNDMQSSIADIYKHCSPGSTLIIPWGDEGAIACNDEQGAISVKAYTPLQGVVDTLGAGDTFVAAFIFTQCSQRTAALPLNEALTYACRVAGEKCGRHGFDAVTPIP